jgi:hypothetical protein
MRYDDQKPALITVLIVLGWLAIFGAVGMALIRSSYYTAPLPGLAWTEIISTAVGGILFLTFAGIIRGLHRIEQAIRETSATPLASERPPQVVDSRLPRGPVIQTVFSKSPGQRSRR